MRIAENDNQTLAEFKANEPPKPSVAELRPGGTFYSLAVDGRKFALVRTGINFAAGMPGPMLCHYPTAGAPHPMCPEHTYHPTAPVRCAPKMKKPLPSYLRAV